MNFENETQKAVYNALTSNDDLMCLITDVYDFVDQNYEYPYLTIGESDDDEYDTFYEVGRDSLFSVHVWSNGRGTKEAYDILAKVYESLNRVKLIGSDDLNFINCSYESGDMLRDDGGMIWHGVHQYRILIEEI